MNLAFLHRKLDHNCALLTCRLNYKKKTQQRREDPRFDLQTPQRATSFYYYSVCIILLHIIAHTAHINGRLQPLDIKRGPLPLTELGHE